MWKEYPKSKVMYEEAKKVFAMGVGSQVQSFSRPHPLYITHGKGSKIYDVDGNEFIDYLLNLFTTDCHLISSMIAST